MESELDLLIRDCDHILRLNHLVAAYDSSVSCYTNKKQCGNPDYREVSEACEAPSLWNVRNHCLNRKLI